MSSKTTQYPLSWPYGWPRNKEPTKSRFSTSITGALNNVRDQLRMFGNDTEKEVSEVLISSNVTLGEQRPKDGGVAVYFRWDNSDCCIAVDRYLTPEENLQAISLVIDAERAKMRHGGLNIVRAAFRGYLALPPADAANKISAPWWQILSVDKASTLPEIEAVYHKLVKDCHPDLGGDRSRFLAIADAIRQARESFANSQ